MIDGPLSKENITIAERVLEDCIFVNFVCIPFHTAVSFKSLNSWRLYCWGFNGLLLCCRDVLDTNEQSFRKIYVLNQLKQEQCNSVIMQQQKQQNLYSVDTNF